MKTLRWFSAWITVLSLPMFFGSACSFGQSQPVCSIAENAERLPGAGHPFAGYHNPKGRPVGASCAYDNQCATNRCNGDLRAGACGECVTIRALGETCTGPHEGCSKTAVCQDGICKSLRKGEGEECGLGCKDNDLEQCDIEFFCAPTQKFSGSGTCTRRTPPGECCDGAGKRCAFGTICSPETFTCEVYNPDACANGYICGGETVCGDDGLCHPGTLPEHATCQRSHGRDNENRCSPGLICIALKDANGHWQKQGSCLPNPGQDEPCLDYPCAKGLFCSQLRTDYRITHCEVLPGEGEACAHDSHSLTNRCAEGLECRAELCQAPCQ